MASNLTDQVRPISEVTKAGGLGELSKQVNVDFQGEMLDLKLTVNSMVNQTLANEVSRVSLEEGILGGQAFVPDIQGIWNEVTRVAREVGTEGKLEGQARVAIVGGTWKDLTNNMNVIANDVGGHQ